MRILAVGGVEVLGLGPAYMRYCCKHTGVPLSGASAGRKGGVLIRDFYNGTL